MRPHKGMNITVAEWDASLEALVRLLGRRGVGERDTQGLLGLLAPMHPDVVGQ